MEVVEFGKIPGDSIVVVCQGVSVSVVEHIGVCVGHGDSSSCPGEHGEVVGHVTEGDDLRCGDVVVGGPLCECGGFGDSWGGHFGEASRAGEGEEGAVVEDIVHLCEEGCVIEMWCLGEEFSYWDIDHCFDECPACVGSVWVLGYEVGSKTTPVCRSAPSAIPGIASRRSVTMRCTSPWVKPRIRVAVWVVKFHMSAPLRQIARPWAGAICSSGAIHRGGRAVTKMIWTPWSSSCWRTRRVNRETLRSGRKSVPSRSVATMAGSICQR